MHKRVLRWRVRRILLSISILAIGFVAYAADGLNLKLKDGTPLSGAKIYVPTLKHSTGMPNGNGVILMVHDKLYIHHFPYRQPRKVMRMVEDGVDDGIYKTAAVMEELEHYHARSSPSERSPSELIYSCTPSRLAFFHFDRPSLKVLRKAISNNTDIPKTHRTVALTAIENAYYANPNSTYYNTPRHSRIWQAEADRDVARYQKHVFYGKWIDEPSLAPATFQKLLQTNRERSP